MGPLKSWFAPRNAFFYCPAKDMFSNWNYLGVVAVDDPKQIFCSIRICNLRNIQCAVCEMQRHKELIKNCDYSVLFLRNSTIGFCICLQLLVNDIKTLWYTFFARTILSWRTVPQIMYAKICAILLPKYSNGILLHYISTVPHHQ